VQRPIAEIVGTVVVVELVDDELVVELVEIGLGAPVENRHPAPGGLNAVILTTGGGSCIGGPDGCVVGVVDVEGRLVVEPDAIDVVEREVVVDVAAGEWCSLFSWNPTTTSTETHSPSPTRKGQLGPAPGRVASFGI
jgi:hypothetical protein